MAKEFFKDLPNTTTPLTADRLNGLLDGEEAMGNLVVDSIRSKNLLDTFSFVKGKINASGSIANESGTTSLNTTKNSIVFTTNTAWNNGATSGFIPVSEGSYTYSGTSDKKIFYYVDTYNSSKGWVSRIVEANQTGAGSRTFTIGSGVAYIRFHYETSTADTYTITNPQIERGSATTYSPYQELDNKEIYSTGETIVGTWIDGKPIYRKVVKVTLTTTNTWTYFDNIFDNLSELVTFKGFYTPNNYSYNRRFVTEAGNDILAQTNNGRLACQTTNSSAINVPWTITIEYTKKTD